MIKMNVLFLRLSNICGMLFSIYSPAINATITESMAQICDETRLKMLIASMGGLFQLLFHASLLRARIHISIPLILLVPTFLEETFSVIWKSAKF